MLVGYASGGLIKGYTKKKGELDKQNATYMGPESFEVKKINGLPGERWFMTLYQDEQQRLYYLWKHLCWLNLYPEVPLPLLLFK